MEEPEGRSYQSVLADLVSVGSKILQHESADLVYLDILEYFRLLDEIREAAIPQEAFAKVVRTLRGNEREFAMSRLYPGIAGFITKCIRDLETRSSTKAPTN